MAVQAIIFYLLASVVVASAACTILARNPVHSVLWLVLAFFNAAGLFLMLGAEFLAMILVIVYVGAVAVLFLFVVMMLDIDFAELRAGFARYLPFGMLLALILLAELVMVVGSWTFSGVALKSAAAPVTLDIAAASPPGTKHVYQYASNTQALGSLIYTKYIFVFQAAGMILLTAMIGAIVLTHRQRKGVKRQNIAAQVARTPESAVDVVKVPVGQGVDVG